MTDFDLPGPRYASILKPKKRASLIRISGGNYILGTDIRPEVSEKNQFWISKDRYYELKHFCLQYPDWVKEYRSLTDIWGLASTSFEKERLSPTNKVSDPEFECYLRQEELIRKIDLVKNTAILAANDLYVYILKGVTEGCTYSKLRLQTGIPCCKDVYYTLYRKFFWLLDKARK